MKQFTIYNLESGEIVRSGYCKEIDFDLQAKDAEGIVEGYCDSNTGYIANGKIVKYTQSQKDAKFNKPKYNCQWSNQTFQWIDLTTDIERQVQACAYVKTIRNQLLAESDWTQMPDVSLINKQDWAVYRQALRDIPEQSGYPFNINWPVKPE